MNIVKAIENRQYSGKRLNKHSVFHNRAAANRLANRKVRQKLEQAHERKRDTRRYYLQKNEEYVSYMSRFQMGINPVSHAAVRSTLLQRSHAAHEAYSKARRTYDKVVEEANDVIKNWEIVQAHYRAQYTS